VRKGEQGTIKAQAKKFNHLDEMDKNSLKDINAKSPLRET
jgi:hypothetical protein